MCEWERLYERKMTACKSEKNEIILYDVILPKPWCQKNIFSNLYSYACEKAKPLISLSLYPPASSVQRSGSFCLESQLDK